MGLNADISDPGNSDISIGKNCIIKNAIIDKNTKIGTNCLLVKLAYIKIGDNCIIRNSNGVNYYDSEEYYIRDGIVVMPRNTVIKSGTII